MELLCSFKTKPPPPTCHFHSDFPVKASSHQAARPGSVLFSLYLETSVFHYIVLVATIIYTSCISFFCTESFCLIPGWQKDAECVHRKRPKSKKNHTSNWKLKTWNFLFPTCWYKIHEFYRLWTVHSCRAEQYTSTSAHFVICKPTLSLEQQPVIQQELWRGRGTISTMWAESKCVREFVVRPSASLFVHESSHFTS